MTLVIVRDVENLLEEILPHLGETTVIMTGKACYIEHLDGKVLYLKEHCESLGIKNRKTIDYKELISLITESERVMVW